MLALFSFGVEFLVNFFEVGVGDVGIDLGSGDVGVAEHGLDGAEIGAIHKEVGGKTMAESVRGDMLGDAGKLGISLDDALDGAGSETPIIAGGVDGLEIFTVIKEEGSEGIGAGVEIVTDAFGGGFGDEDRTVLVAFATDNKFATLEINRITIELDEFGDAEATREK